MKMNRRELMTTAFSIAPFVAAAQDDSWRRPRARELGLAPGVFTPGRLNAIETPVVLTNTICWTSGVSGK